MGKFTWVSDSDAVQKEDVVSINLASKKVELNMRNGNVIAVKDFDTDEEARKWIIQKFQPEEA